MEKNLSLGVAMCVFGSDPEFFFKKDGKVLPSSEVINEETRGVIIDGFQGELNPAGNTCRQSSGSNIAYALYQAGRLANKAGAKISFDMGQFITDDVWYMVPRELKRFGCSPTMNVYEDKFRRVSGLRERFRSAGGHIHIGGVGTTSPDYLKENIDKIVQVMDIVVGNTCVLIDRDPLNARRRKIYGRAGEHRMKSYGLEYRVPSNFWLKDYVLWSLVSGLARCSVSIHKSGHADNLISKFDMRKVRKAINDNDFDLAKDNLNILRDYIIEYEAYNSYTLLSTGYIDTLVKWATSSNPLEGIGTDTEILDRWETRTDRVGAGIEVFLDYYKNTGLHWFISRHPDGEDEEYDEDGGDFY